MTIILASFSEPSLANLLEALLWDRLLCGMGRWQILSSHDGELTEF